MISLFHNFDEVKLTMDLINSMVFDEVIFDKVINLPALKLAEVFDNVNIQNFETFI